MSDHPMPPVPQECVHVWWDGRLWNYLYWWDGNTGPYLRLKWWDGSEWAESAVHSPAAHAELLRLVKDNKELLEGAEKMRKALRANSEVSIMIAANSNLEDAFFNFSALIEKCRKEQK